MPSNDNERLSGDAKDYRREFLIHAYDQLWNHINSHLLVVWQSIGVMIGIFAALALVQKNILPLDLATALIIGAAAWLAAHVYDAAYWYNRNLAIITNIERQFLTIDDLKLVHPYFKDHRSGGLIGHLRIQLTLAASVATVFLVYDFAVRHPLDHLTLKDGRLLPLGTFVVGFAVLLFMRHRYEQAYGKFLRDAPGLPIIAHNPSSTPSTHSTQANTSAAST